MSEFDSAFATVVPDHFDLFGRSITYSDPESDDVTITAIVGRERTEERNGSHGICEELVREVIVRTDTTSDEGGVTDPARIDTVTIDEIEYAVEPISIRENEATFRCVRVEGAEISRGNYRGAIPQ